jgi:hypothetical protein
MTVAKAMVMRPTTDLDVVVDTRGDVTDGVPEAIESIAYDRTLLAPRPRPFARLRTARGTTDVHPRVEGSDGIPMAVQHEDDDVCVGLWCEA